MSRPSHVCLCCILMLALRPYTTGATGFLDANLEAAVRQALGNKDGTLTQTELSSLTQLSARDMHIGSLEGIQQLTGLTATDLAINEIVDVGPLSALTSLQLLDLEENQIEDISPLASLTALQYVVLNHNRIAEVTSLADLPALESVELRGNPLSAAAVADQIPALQSRGVSVLFDVHANGDDPQDGDGGLALGWEYLGPEEESEQTLSVYRYASSLLHPEAIFVTTGRGNWRSADGGETWVSAGMQNVYGAFMDPEDPLKLYGTASQSTYRSTDGGENWGTLQPPGELRQVDPIRSGCLYAGDQWADEPLQISYDDGTTWEELAPFERPWSRMFVWAHPADYSIRYAGALGWDAQGSVVHTVVRSHDNCQTWETVELGQRMDGIAPDPTDPEALYGVDLRNVWHSVDGGETWMLHCRTPVNMLSVLRVHPANPDWMWAWRPMGGFYESRDRGETWDLIFSDADVFPHPRDGMQALAVGRVDGTIRALHRTRDGGESWQRVGLQSRHMPVAALAFAADGILHGISPRRLLTRTVPVLLTSGDGGCQWRIRDEQLREGFSGKIERLHVNPQHPRVLIAYGDDGYLRSEDDGVTWESLVLSTGGSELGHSSLSSAGEDGETYYSVDERDAGLYRSVDYGLTWTRVLEEVRCMGLHPESPEVVYVGKRDRGGVWRSQDGGGTWEERGVVSGGKQVLGLACDPRDGNHLFAVAEGGFHESHDGGQEWMLLAPVPVDIWDPARILFHPETPEVMYLRTAPALLGSTDGGHTWISLREEMVRYVPWIQDVALDPTDPGMVYIGTAMGVYRRRWPAPVTAVVEETNVLPATCELGQNYPNPFNAWTAIPYWLPRSTSVKLMVYNAAGQLMSELVQDTQEAGSYRLVWDGTDAQGRQATSGVYFYRLQAGGFQQSRRLLLLK